MNTLIALRRILPSLAVGAVGGLFGYSIAYQDPHAADHQTILILGGIAVATASALIVQLGSFAISMARRALGVTPSTAQAEGPRKHQAFRSAAVGFMIALVGWFVGAFLDGKSGFLVVLASIVWGGCSIVWGLVTFAPWRNR